MTSATAVPTVHRIPTRNGDELRVLDDRTLVGMSYVDRPLLRRLGLPFLLVLDAG